MQSQQLFVKEGLEMARRQWVRLILWQRQLGRGRGWHKNRNKNKSEYKSKEWDFIRVKILECILSAKIIHFKRDLRWQIEVKPGDVSYDGLKEKCKPAV